MQLSIFKCLHSANLSIFNLRLNIATFYGTPSIDFVKRIKPFSPFYLCAVLSAKRSIMSHSTLKYFGGLKWTRTIDLTLIRRVL